MRIIINLKHLNRQIEFIHFKMESLKQVPNLLRKGDLMVKIDLKDAYWNVPIGKKSQELLCFDWGEKRYKFLVLPFGLGPAPRMFTKLMKVPIFLLRRLGIRIIIYLDDMWIVGSSIQEITMARDTTIFLLESLGLVINWEKSSLTALPSCEFLGVIINSLMMSISLPVTKSLDLISMCNQVKALRAIPLRILAKLVGKLLATSPAVSVAPIQIRSLQLCLIQALHQKKCYEDTIQLDKDSILELNWWIINLKIIQGKPVNIVPPQVIISTDASLSAWGAHMEGGSTIGDQWSPSERLLHINILELLAVELALKTFLKERKVESVTSTTPQP